LIHHIKHIIQDIISNMEINTTQLSERDKKLLNTGSVGDIRKRMVAVLVSISMNVSMNGLYQRYKDIGIVVVSKADVETITLSDVRLAMEEQMVEDKLPFVVYCFCSDRPGFRYNHLPREMSRGREGDTMICPYYDIRDGVYEDYEEFDSDEEIAGYHTEDGTIKNPYRVTIKGVHYGPPEWWVCEDG